MKLYFREVNRYIPDMLKGLGTSILLAAVGMLVGTLLGLLLYLGRSSKYRVLRGFCYGYIEVIRNTPLLVQLYLIYFGLAQYGIDVSAMVSTIFAMVLNNAAYTAEILRAGFLSVQPGTIEAGYALGMNKAQVFMHVRLMPAFKSAYPALINQAVLLFLFSSVASIIALHELTYVSMNTASITARNFETYLYTGLLYYVTCFVIINVSRLGEKKLMRW